MRKASRDHLTEDYQAANALALAGPALVVSPGPALRARAGSRPLRINLLQALELGWLECGCGQRWVDDGGVPRCPACGNGEGIKRGSPIFGTGVRPPGEAGGGR